MNTIFDKIQRGFIEPSTNRIFNQIDYYKKPELIKPYLHYLDNQRLNDSIETQMSGGNHLSSTIRNFTFNTNIDKDQLFRDAYEFFNYTFPKETSADLFNMYHKEASSLTYVEKTNLNKFRYKMLEHMIDPVARVISKDSNVKSMIMTKSMIEYLCIMMAYQKQTNIDDFKELEKQMKSPNSDEDAPDGDSDQNNEGDGNSKNTSNDDLDNNQPSNQAGNGEKDSYKNPDDLLNKLINDQNMQKIQEEILDEAKKEISDLSELTSDEEIEAAWRKGGVGFNRESIDRVKQEYDKLNLNMDKINVVIKKLLSKSINYFSGKEIVKFDSLFDAGTVDGLQDYELLHPKLRKFMIDDVMVKNVTKKGKIDLYIDTSGSMSNDFSYEGKTITNLDFTKVFAMQMLKQKMIRNLYAFDNTVTKLSLSDYSIMLVADGGGTNLNNVIHHINKEKNNAIIITDAEDQCYTYSPLAYFIGVEGCRFSYFNKNTIAEYAENDQVIQFNGSGIKKILSNGFVETEIN